MVYSWAEDWACLMAVWLGVGLVCLKVERLVDRSVVQKVAWMDDLSVAQKVCL
jgi:hypothetical protein